MNPEIKSNLMKFMDYKILLPLFFVAFLGVLYQSYFSEAPKTQKSDNFSPDTVIPAGHVLIPIAIANAEALSSMVGGYAVVDVFTVKGEHQKAGLKILSRAKLIRAPLNPDQYAVLLRDSETKFLLQQEGPFFVVIQNPNIAAKTELSRANTPTRSLEVL